ncbi:MAG: acyl-CoA thioesterase [Treponema sp.]|nr:acyl-CoA thioesterase [Treponema sp.]
MKLKSNLIQDEIVFKVEFYDVDSMQIVWHGNYVKYMEKARCSLLEGIGYGYLDMERTGYAFPLVDIKFKYIRSLHFGEHCRVKSTLVEYENCIKIKYEFICEETGLVTTKAESTQMCVRMSDGVTCFVCPDVFLNCVKEKLNEKNS